MPARSSRGLLERLKTDVVVGAEGYVFELERRGYIKAGPYVPEVVLDFPEAVRELHREFLRAGADVMVALTYYAHREKLKTVGRENDLEALNRQALRVANEGARGRCVGGWRYLQYLGLRSEKQGGLLAGGPRDVRGAAVLGRGRGH